jgi:hypothetical protein
MSLDRESEINLARDAPAAADFLASRGGQLHSPCAEEPGVWWGEFHPASDEPQTYFARLAWRVYPGAPPSVKFAVSVGGSLDDPTAWPIAAGFRPTSLDICMPFTAEGFALHPNWCQSSHAWSPAGNPFLAVVRELQRRLNGPSYRGRFSR